MDKVTFDELMTAIHEVDDFMNSAGELGINLIESKLYDGITSMFKIAFVSNYGEEAYDWVSWYLYELPMVLDKTEPVAWDKDGNPIEFKNDNDLFMFLEKNRMEEAYKEEI